MDKWINAKKTKPTKLTKVLVVFVNSLGSRKMTFAEYVPEKEVLEEDYLDWEYCDDNNYDEETGQAWAPAGWYELTEEQDVDRRINGTITHWQPCPKFPAIIQKTAVVNNDMHFNKKASPRCEFTWES